MLLSQPRNSTGENNGEWLFDVENRLDYLTANGDILPTLKNLIPREDFRSELEVIYDHERKSNAGRRPFDVVMMFKILILQSLYNPERR